MTESTEQDFRDSKAKLVRQSIVTFGASGLNVLIRLIKSGVMTRALGPAGRGIFGMAMLIGDYVASFGDLGFGAAVVYFVGKKKRDLRGVLGGILLFTLLMGPLLAVAAYVALHLDFLYKDDVAQVRRFAVLIVLSVPLYVVQRFGIAILHGSGRIKTVNALWLLESILPLLLFVLLWKTGWMGALNAAITAWFVGVALVCVVAYSLLVGQGAYPPRVDLAFFGEAFRYGIQGYFANIFVKTLRRTSFFFVAALVGAEDLGYFMIAAAMAEMLMLLPESVLVPFIPLVYGMNKEDSTRFTPMVVRLNVALMVAGCVVTLLVGKTMLWLIFGEAFLLAFNAMACLLPGMIALTAYQVLKNDLFGRNKPRVVSQLTTVGLVAAIVLNCVLVPKYGIVGAAIASSISYILPSALLGIYFCRLTGNRIPDVLFLRPSEARKVWDAIVERIKSLWR